MENLMEVDIPEDVQVKLKEMEAKEQEQLEREVEELLKSESEKKEPKSTAEDGLSR